MLYLISMKRPQTTVYRLTLSLQFAWTPQELTVHDASKTRKIGRIVFVTRFFRSLDVSERFFCMFSFFLWYVHALRYSKYSLKREWFWESSHSGLFTIHGSGTGGTIWNGAATIANNGFWSLYLSWARHHVLEPIGPSPVPCPNPVLSVNIP